ncbi:MAG TPA: TfoX/Sxy family protein [Propionibacteriaceae bacterium]
MPYDLELADRLRDLLSVEPEVTEKKMFGGLVFLVRGHMTVCAVGRGGIMLRVDPAQTDALLAEPQTSPIVMQGREMNGWLHVDIDTTAGDDELGRWVDLGLSFVETLPPK